MKTVITVTIIALVSTGAYAKGPTHKAISTTPPPCASCGVGLKYYQANLFYFAQTYLPWAEQCNCTPTNPTSVHAGAPKKLMPASSRVCADVEDKRSTC